MANGILGTAALSAVANTSLYTVPTAKTATLNISLCNRGDVGVKVRIALAAASTPTTAEYIEYDATIPPNGVLERTGIVMQATKQVVVYVDTATVSAVAFGYEE